MSDLLLRDVRPNGGPAADLLIRGGRIAALGPGLAAPAGVPVEAGGGAIAIAPFVEPHVHLDKILWGLPWRPIEVEPELRAMIDNEKRIRAELPWSVADRAGRLIRQCVACGTTHIRSHVDIDPQYGLANLEGVLEAHAGHAHAVGLEIVAFPQAGLVSLPGTRELLAAALDAGAAVVGGIDPAGIDGDPKGHLDAVFGLAERKAAKVDIHLHERGELGLFDLERIVERTRALGLEGRVVVSHAFCLADAEEARLARLVDALARAGIGIVSAVPGNRPIPPLFRLAEAGVKVAIASDSIRDTWNPHGNGDLLERAWLLAWRLGLKRDRELLACLGLASRGGADLLGLEGHGLAVGAEGSLVLLEAECLPAAVVDRPRRRLVVKRGRVVAREGAWVGPAPEA